MKKKVFIICIFLMLVHSTTICYSNEVSFDRTSSNPPEDIVWPFNSPNIADWLGATINAGGHSGRVESVEDTNGDGQVGYCDNIVVNWRSSNLRQPYYKYHCEKRTYVDDPTDPDYGRYKFELDYKSKSRNAPKLSSCCHYVDDDNTAGPWDGSFEHPYRNIQDAINVANTGDQVHVLPGEYYENIIIDKPLALRRHLDYFESNIDLYAGNSGSSVIVLEEDADFCLIEGINVRGATDFEDIAGIICYSDYNTIYGCDITDNSNGIYLLGSANNNLIIENKIHANDFNFFVGSDPFDNLVYHNEFYDPEYFNAKDLGTNQWDDGEGRGNYWDDYEGEDVNGDGIGDDPHPILGGFNFDNYPIENKTKWPFNTKPYIDKFEGETEGTTGEKYGYAVRFYDDEFHDAILEIDWDDGTPVEYVDYWGVGEEYTFYHTWSNQGSYNVKVRAIDTLGLESDWEYLDVTMPKHKTIFHSFIQFLENILYPLFYHSFIK